MEACVCVAKPPFVRAHSRLLPLLFDCWLQFHTVTRGNVLSSPEKLHFLSKPLSEVGSLDH